MRVLEVAAGLIAAALLIVGAPIAAVAYPYPFFGYHTSLGRLALYADRPFDAAAGQRVLTDVAARLATSPLNDDLPHAIFVANAPWREALFFNVAQGAAGVNDYPLTNNVFIRRSDIDRDTVFGPSGKPAAPPRTFAYYAAHEIAHSLTAERLGAAHLWNHGLPQWVREGYADYVGMGSQVDIADLYRRWRGGDPELNYRKSGTYAHFRLLTAVMLESEHWSVDRLLACRWTLTEADARMIADLAGTGVAPPPAHPAQRHIAA